MDKKLREFVISVLDNDNGISDKSFTILNEIAEKYKLEDIVLAVSPIPKMKNEIQGRTE